MHCWQKSKRRRTTKQCTRAYLIPNLHDTSMFYEKQERTRVVNIGTYACTFHTIMVARLGLVCVSVQFCGGKRHADCMQRRALFVVSDLYS